MITLYTFGPAFGLPDPSPFVTKVDILLKLAQVPFEVNSKVGLRKAPKGKLPFIEDDGKIIADSTLIRWHLEQKYKVDFDAALSSSERGISWAVEKMLEDNFYWVTMHSRWVDDANFEKGPAEFFRAVPWPIRSLIERMIRRKVNNSLKAQGTGRHSEQDIVTIGGKSIEAVAMILGDKPYLLGEQPCGADATCFAFMAGILCPHFDTPLRTITEKQPNVVAYVKRLRNQFYLDA